MIPLVFLLSCTEQAPFKNDATIIGFDFRRCACCGGIFFEIEGDTLRSPIWPEGFEFDESKDSLPIDVKLNWDYSSDPCLGDEIEVYSLKITE